MGCVCRPISWRKETDAGAEVWVYRVYEVLGWGVNTLNPGLLTSCLLFPSRQVFSGA